MGKISDLTALTTIDDADVFVVNDVSDTTDSAQGSTKQITRANALAGVSKTGHTHAISDVTSLQTTLDGKAASSHTHTPSQVGLGNVTNDAQVKASEKGVANGVATLDSGGKVPSAQLPATGATNLDGLTDVTISGAISGQVLKYNGTTWVNDTDATSTGGVGSGDVVGPASAVNAHLAIFSGTDGKTIADSGKAVTDLATSSHTHAIADVTSLQTDLDGKAATSHTHAISDTTGLQTALDGKAATSHTHTSSNVSDFTEAAQDAAAALFTGGSHTGISFSYDDAGNKINATVTGSTGSSSASFATDVPGTPVFVSATQFTITDTGNAGSYDKIFKKGVLLKWTDTTLKKAMVVSSSYAANVVTVNIVGDALTGTFSGMKYLLLQALREGFILVGNLNTVSTDLGRTIFAPSDIAILSVDAFVKTAGTTGSTTFDIKDDGTSIFTTSANRPSIASGATSDLNNAPDVSSAVPVVAAASALTVDVAAVCTTPAVEGYVDFYYAPDSWFYRS